MFMSLTPERRPTDDAHMPAARPVVLVAYAGFQLLDDDGHADVFAAASRLAGVDGTGYRLTTVAASAEPVRASNGTAGLVDGALDDVRGRIDTVMVVGAFEMSGRPIGPDLVDGVRRLARSARRVASVCSGALVLAEAGLLAGRRATTHWFVAPTLARRHPDVAVESDRIYVHDGQVWTSAGVTAGIDLAPAGRPKPVQQRVRGRGAGRRNGGGGVEGLPCAALVDGRAPGRGPVRAGARRARSHECAPFLPLLRRPGWHAAWPLC